MHSQVSFSLKHDPSTKTVKLQHIPILTSTMHCLGDRAKQKERKADRKTETPYLIGVRTAARCRRGRERDNVRVPREIDGARLHALGKLGARGGDW